MKQGYSLVEAIAVIALVAIVSTLVLANYGTSRDQQRMKKTTTDALSALREAQGYALAGSTGTAFGNGQTFGYGVQFTSSNPTYLLYADKNNNDRYDNAVTDTLIETRTFDQNVLPSVVGNCSASVTVADIVFRPPHPTTVATKTLPLPVTPCTTMCINFLYPNGTQISKVTVSTTSGLIQSQEQNASQLGVCP